MAARQQALGSQVLDGAVGGGLFGTNLKVGAGILDAQEAISPSQRDLSNAMIVASLAGAGAVLVNEYRENR